MKTTRIFSHGMGTQSVAVMVGGALGLLPRYDHYIFANVGENSERPETLRYFRDVMLPFAQVHGLDLIEVRLQVKGGSRDLFSYAVDDNRDLPLPVYFSDGGVANRSCTIRWKVRPVQQWIRQHYAGHHVVLGIGYSSDEAHRASKKPSDWHDQETYWDVRKKQWSCGSALGFTQRYEYPLIDAGMNRQASISLIERAGLPIPSASHCTGCPFNSMTDWLELRRNNQDEFARMIEFEELLNNKYQRIRGRSSRIYLYRGRIPLSELPDQLPLWADYLDKDSSCDEAGSVCGV